MDTIFDEDKTMTDRFSNLNGGKPTKKVITRQEGKLLAMMNLSRNQEYYLDSSFRYIWINKAYETRLIKDPELFLGHEVRGIVGE